MKRIKNFTLLFILGLLVVSCDNDDSLNPVTDPVLDNIRYDLDERSESGVRGDAVFNEQADGSVQLILEVEGTSAGNMHPAHIHMNSAVEGGSIIVSLEPVDGETGLSITTFTSLDDGTPLSYEDISELDAYINVHLSANDLGTIVAQGDIGQNELTGESKSYDLEERAVPGISGSVLFEERLSGEALATISLDGTPDGGMHPAHIHMNSAVEGGAILYTFNPVNGTTGMSQSNVATLDGGSEFVYADILEVDGYVNVHLSADDLGTIVAQSDIGQNELTGEFKSYDLEERAVPGISGSVLFEERLSGEALATISLDGTPDGGQHPAHIHMNTAVEGGSILYSFNPVNGTTGMSQSNVATLDDGTAFVYADVLEVDGYVNIHLSADDLGTIVAQGDIGQNELTGESKSYELEERAVAGISGSVLFEERLNGEALATISLEGTPDGGEHPAHIHMNTAVEGGGILYTFNPVNGTTGMSQSNVAALDDDTEFSYADVLDVDGYVNVHLSAGDLGTIVAQGDIGQNELTGEFKSYVLEEKDVTGINGTVLFEERLNGEALATISLVGTPDGGEHPAHIHANSASEGGGIIYTFTPVNGTTGMSMSNVAALDDDTEFGYADVLEVNGYVNVHLSAAELATIVAQGDIGANE
ncbi:CHRD domain-containing protein [Psychroflexus lacisalsi]|uniref:CHRD domain-containing protein n=1 Tax=Psychroflexus lacisalsi TaxID=503928 RepID=A0ABN1KDU4_9FLAO|nr:CHRD domain-containing protein [Psychroflexus lacisalsi]MBZ9620300.1 CHRD domain-containing protein [Psychroflexus lacisalsi]